VQIRLLGILRDREPGMLELAHYLGLEKSSLSGLVDRAERRRLLARIPSSADRRAATIRVTARGRKLSRVIEAAAHAEIRALVRPLSRRARVQLVATLSQLSAARDHAATKRLSEPRVRRRPASPR
jgi:DNA-binding MarR family transcriptional regulator